MRVKKRILLIIFTLLYTCLYLIFYHKYIPHIWAIQVILVPVILFLNILTFFSIEKGTLGLIVLIPLVNSLPLFFNIEGVNPLLFIFFGFAIGVFLHYLIHPIPIKLDFLIFKPIFGVSIILFLSAVITLWRYANFVPIHDNSIHELAINVLNVSSGEALRRVTFDFLNYLAGFFWFIVIIHVFRTKKIIKTALLFLASSTVISFLFGFYQAFVNHNLGNREYFAKLDRINSLFTDPNALGVYIVLSISLFVGAVAAFKDKSRILFMMPVISGILIMPFSGSRSGLLGLSLVFLLFIFYSIKRMLLERKRDSTVTKRLLPYFLITVISVLFISVLIISLGHTVLSKRVEQSVRSLFKSEDTQSLFYGRNEVWQSSVHMVKHFPLSGIGIGAFTCELPNFYKEHKIVQILPPSYYKRIPPGDEIFIDSAGNYYMHIASELGLITLFFFCWIFYIIIKQIYFSVFKQKSETKWTFLRAGFSFGILALLVIFLFGAHTLSFEIQLLFWLMIGAFYSLLPNKKEKLSLNGRKMMVWLIPIIVFSLSFFWNSTHSLSLHSRTQKFSLIQNFGLYHEEMMGERRFRWTKKNAGITVHVKKAKLTIPLIATHPDINQKPVHVKIFLSRDFARSKILLDEVILTQKVWKDFSCDLSDDLYSRIMLLFEVDRTWQPKKYLDTLDTRNLGIGLGTIQFIDSSEDDSIKYPSEYKRLFRFSQSDWKGEQGGNLFWKGTCWKDVSLPKGYFMFKIAAKGQKAENEWPYMIVRLNNEVIGGEWISSEEWEFYLFKKRLDPSQYRISIEFFNDFYSEHSQEDRNLIIGDLEIYKIE